MDEPPYVRPAIFPKGLIGDVAEYIYRSAPYPNATIALTAALGLLAGMCGRAYNFSRVGLNLYLLVLARTGTGKEQISSGIGWLLAMLEKMNAKAAHFRGPGELVSAPGLFKWLARMPNPVMFCIISEFGLMLKAMLNPKNAVMAGLQRLLLQLYPKSEYGSVFDASAYSDPEKGSAAIFSPSLTIIGEGTGETFYSVLNDNMVESGLFTRFITFDSDEPRPYENQNRILEPCPQLMDRLGAVAMRALELGHNNSVHQVGAAPDAAILLAKFERFTTDQVNNGGSQIARHMWSRAKVKAMKIAAIQAVGRDPINPMIAYDDVEWATNLIVNQTNALIAKFENGEVGEEEGDEARQHERVAECIYEYMTQKFDRFEKYRTKPDMHRDGVFTSSYLSQRLRGTKAFKDSQGSTRALNRTLATMLENDEIREIPKRQLEATFGTGARSFVVSDPKRFIAGRKIGKSP